MFAILSRCDSYCYRYVTSGELQMFFILLEARDNFHVVCVVVNINLVLTISLVLPHFAMLSI